MSIDLFNLFTQLPNEDTITFKLIWFAIPSGMQYYILTYTPICEMQ